MDAGSLGSGNRICTVLFVDLVRYSQEPVSRQVEMKARFDALLTTALEHTPVADRLVLDTGDGAALCFLGDPEDALFAANSIRAGVRGTGDQPPLQLRLGINLGPVRVVKDINGHSNVLGDGINVAQRVMSFAAPNQILVSRSYFEVVSRLSPEYGQLFQYAGLHRDKHVREHEVYEVQLAAGASDDAPLAVAELPTGPPASPVAEAEPAPRFEPDLLARLTAVLAREIGPVAKLVVRKAAERATDRRTLCATLAESLPESGRRASVLADLADAVGAVETPPGPSGTVVTPGQAGKAPEVPGPQGGINPALLARAEQLLSRRIGPLARVLVRRAAKDAASPRDLFERLAVHIDDEGVRRAFAAEAGRLRPGDDY